MKRRIITVALASFAIASFADDQHRSNALESQQYSVAKRQIADAEEWLRSRHGGHQDSSSHQG
jgi:hypothetical protein